MDLTSLNRYEYSIIITMSHTPNNKVNWISTVSNTTSIFLQSKDPKKGKKEKKNYYFYYTLVFIPQVSIIIYYNSCRLMTLII